MKANHRRAGVDLRRIGLNTRQRRLAAWATACAWVYPLLVVAALYGTWLLGWLELGHPPRPSLDDPWSISPLFSLICYVARLVETSIPVGIICGVFATGWFGSMRHVAWPQRATLIAVLLAVWAVAILFLRWDPLAVVQWLGD